MMVFSLSSVWLFSTVCFLLEVGALDEVSNITLPVCHVLNASLDCPIPCWGNKWEVTLQMMGHNGTKVHPSAGMSPLKDPNDVQTKAVFKNAPVKNATFLTLTASCCREKVEVFAVDTKGNRGLCNFTIRRSSTMMTAVNQHQDQSVRSNSPSMIISLWTTSLLLHLSALML